MKAKKSKKVRSPKSDPLRQRDSAARVRRLRGGERVVDAVAFRRRTRQRAGWIAALRGIRAAAEEAGFRWTALVQDV